MSLTLFSFKKFIEIWLFPQILLNVNSEALIGFSLLCWMAISYGSFVCFLLHLWFLHYFYCCRTPIFIMVVFSILERGEEGKDLFSGPRHFINISFIYIYIYD